VWKNGRMVIRWGKLKEAGETAFVTFRQSPTNAQTINEGID
jgi:hypothetical protein